MATIQKKHNFSLKEKFGVPVPSTVMVQGYEKRTETVPEIDPDYEFPTEVLRDVINWHEAPTKDGILLFGPPGCGKTTALLQFAARLNIPVYEKTVYDRLHFEELVGHYQIVGGNTAFVYGPLCKAMGVHGQPGILLLNEIHKAHPGVVTGLNEVLQGATLDVMGRETLRPMPGFRVAVTANTSLLLGDTIGLHAGSRRQDYAFIDRFWQVRCHYPPRETELRIIAKKVPKLPREVAEGLVDVANEIRAQYMGESKEASAHEVTISTRALVRWAMLTEIYKGAAANGVDPISYALYRAILNVASPETQEAIHRVVNAKFKPTRAAARGG